MGFRTLTVTAPDLDLRRKRIEHRLRMEKAQQRQQEFSYPTQRPNGSTPLSSPWFRDDLGVRCRLLSEDPLTVSDYTVMMDARGATRCRE
jgi:hypothetical protein